MSSAPLKVGILVVPRFPMLAFVCTADPLATINWLKDRIVYDLNVYSTDDSAPVSFNGFGTSPVRPMAEAPALDLVIVCAGLGVEQHCSPKVRGWLRYQAQHGAIIGSVSFGAHIVADAGLYDGHRATAHWEHIPNLRELFPKVLWTHSIFEYSSRRLSCAGGTSALDMVLHMLEQSFGPELPLQVAGQYIHDRIRSQQDEQIYSEKIKIKAKSTKLARAISTMEANLSLQLSVEEIAATAGLTARHLSSLFRKHIGMSTSEYYLRLRLNHAQSLLWNTPGSISGIAAEAGFSSQSHFARCYRAQFGRSPRQDRRPESM